LATVASGLNSQYVSMLSRCMKGAAWYTAQSLSSGEHPLFCPHLAAQLHRPAQCSRRECAEYSLLKPAFTVQRSVIDGNQQIHRHVKSPIHLLPTTIGVSQDQLLEGLIIMAFCHWIYASKVGKLNLFKLTFKKPQPEFVGFFVAKTLMVFYITN